MPELSLAQEVLCASVSGCFSTVLGHPLDCIKVHQQTTGISAFTATSRMLRLQGASAFTRGLGAPLANAVLMNSLMFVGFREARRWLPSGTLGTVLAAALSGVTTACISTPVDFIKIQAQLRGSNTRGLLRECGRTPRGLSLFATGHTMNMWREGVFTAIYLGLYTHIKDLMMKDQQAGASPPLGIVLVVSAATGGLAWAACYPFDAVKSVQQGVPLNGNEAKRTIRGAAAELWRRGGVRGFYGGLGASLARACMVTSSRLLAYEKVKAWCLAV